MELHGRKPAVLKQNSCDSVDHVPMFFHELFGARHPFMCQQKTSFDYLIGAHEERRRDREAKRFGGSHVDSKVEMCGALKR